MSGEHSSKMLQELADDGGIVSSDHDKLTEALLRHAASKGFTLEQCSSPKFMDRKIATLRRHVRRIGDLTFPDYIPRKLKPKKERKRGKNT